MCISDWSSDVCSSDLDHGAAFIAGVDQLEEQVAAAWDDRQVADLVDDQQGRSAEEADALRQTTLALGAGELAEQLGEGAEVDAAPGLHGLDAERSEEHTSELQSLMRITYAVFCLKTKLQKHESIS